MHKLSTEDFDYKAERQYYACAPTELHDPHYLDPYYRVFLGEYRSYFDDRCVLDIGAGECLHGYLISEMCKPQCYVNFDLFRDRMQMAFQHNPYERMYFIVGNCFSLPLKASSFEVVWGNGILFRLRPLEKVIVEIGRVLRSGGVYLGVEPNFVNPLVLLRFMLMTRVNRNDGMLSHGEVRKAFSLAGFDLELRFFWKRLPWLRHPFFSTSMGLIAQKL